MMHIMLCFGQLGTEKSFTIELNGHLLELQIVHQFLFENLIQEC